MRRPRWGAIHHRAGLRRRGQGVVELAVLMPVLVLILIGTLDLGRIYIYQTRVNNALKEGAVMGLYQTNLAAIQGRAFREVIDPTLPVNDDRRYLLGIPGVDFKIDALNLYPSTGATSVYNCMTSTNARCTTPAPGDDLEISGYYIFKPITSELLRFLPSEVRIRRTVRTVY